MSKRFTAHLAILTANIIYGMNYSIAKEIIPAWMNPLALVLIRVIGAGLLFWFFGMLGPKVKIEKKDFLILLFGGIFGVAINQMLFLKGLSMTSPIDASIIMTTNPILVLLLASIILHEKITYLKIIGIIIGACGALLIIITGGQASFSSDLVFGNLLIFINALSYGVYLILVKPLMAKYPPIVIIKWVFTFGLFIVFPFGTKPFFEINWLSIPNLIYYAIAFVVLFTTFLAYLLNIFGLKKLSPTTVSIYIYSQPILASIVAIILGKDSLTGLKVISTLLVFAGVYLVSKKPRTVKLN